MRGLENSPRPFGSSPIGRMCARYSVIADVKVFTLTSLVKMRTRQQNVQRVLRLKEFKSVSRCVRTERNVNPPTSKSIHQWERTSKEMGTLVSQTGKNH
ncbi:hypothetical protein TNCV_1982901 [Trichonephila clavipes]|nr:hypothetical protein TNCV_1982901 [Trichonephila clavipes]